MNVFYVLIRTTENYEFDKIRTAGLTGNATTYENSHETIPYVQPEMNSRSPPGQFHHEPPLKDFIQWHVVVICIWCALFVTSQFDVIFKFPNQRFGEVC